MNKKFKVDTIFIGLFVTIALAVFIILFSTPFYEEERLQISENMVAQLIYEGEMGQWSS